MELAFAALVALNLLFGAIASAPDKPLQGPTKDGRTVDQSEKKS